jgi:hypothetical protein
MPAVAQLRAPLAHLIDLPLDRLDAHADTPAVGFEFRFAGAASADAPAEARQGRAGSSESREKVFELCQLDLPPALARPCTAREDVEDQLCAIDDFALEPILELAELSRRQFVIDDDDSDVGFSAGGSQTRDFASADERSGIRLRPLLQHPQRDGRTGCVGEAGQFLERLLSIHAPDRARDQADERGALARIGGSASLAPACGGTGLTAA